MSRQSYFKTSRRRLRARRRGVLLLVVLSVLVLFMLIGTAFLVTSSQYRTSAKVLEKANRTTFQPGDLVERALMDVLRDTNNPYSAIRYHSLLRDAYGTDGFVARVYAPSQIEATNYGTGANLTRPNFAPRFASPLYGPATDLSRGQLIDIYIAEQTPAVAPVAPTADNVVALEPSASGVAVDTTLSKTNGYYNGRLLTMLTGPCRGQTTRVLDSVYEPGVSTALRSIYRLRVLTMARADGGALTPSGRQGGEINELVTRTTTAATPYEGHTFMVSGKPYNGTGVGFNALANIGGPRLSAVETFTEPQNSTLAGIETALLPNAVYYNPGATSIQSPNPVAALNPFIGFDASVNPFASLGPAYTSYEGPGGSDESYDAADYQNMFLAMQSVAPRARGRVVDGGSSENVEDHYSHGGAVPDRIDLEDVTIPSFHRPDLVNFWYHRLLNAPWLQQLISDNEQRAKAILQPYNPTTGAPQYGLNAQMAAIITGIKRRIMLRPLSEDHPEFDGSNPLSRYANTAAIPANFEVANTTTGQITFPYWEAAGPWDVDNDNDGIPDSVWVDIGLPVQKTEDGRFYKPLVAYLIQDMDGRLNLNAHGTAEHFAGMNLDSSNLNGNLNNLLNANLAGVNYTGGPQSTQVLSSNRLPTGIGFGPAEISLRSVLSPVGLPYNNGLTVGDPASDDYARLLYGRPATNVAVNGTYRAIEETWGRYGSSPMNLQMQVAGVMEDPVTNAAIGVAPGITFSAPPDRNPATVNRSIATIERHLPYEKFDYPAYDRQLTQRLANFFPLADPRRAAAEVFGGFNHTGFGVSPDLKASYAVGLDFRGQLVHEEASDVVRAPSVLHDSPYELNIMSAARRDNVANMLSAATSYGTAASVDDDAPFAPAELEKVLRAFDPDASRLPSRLTNLVDAFDSKKLVASIAADPQNPTSAELAQADLQAAINRRQVTTDSFSVPAPNDNWSKRLLLGADGLPGVAAGSTVADPDDDGDGIVDEGDEVVIVPPAADAAIQTLFDNGCDDYAVIMRASAPTNGSLVDFLRYRIVLQLKKQGVVPAIAFGNAPSVELLVNRCIHGDNSVRARNSSSPLPATFDPTSLVATDNRGSLYSFGGLLSQETLAGLKMDLNRPFGDGRDNNGNGVVDEELEAAEPWIDLNGNGQWDGPNNGAINGPGAEPALDLDGDGYYNVEVVRNANGAITNRDGVIAGDAAIDNTDDWHDYDGDGVESPVIDTLWQQQNGGTPVAFDHVRGQDASASGAVTPANARIRDDARLARQLYARHLYCLMLLLVDENYLAPYDPSDPQMVLYLDPTAGQLVGTGANRLPAPTSSMAFQLAHALARRNRPAENPSSPNPAEQAEAKRLAMRKLTCRQIAQWAVNCADMRDPDVIMTPFEYDENPWDGWGVVDSKHNSIYPLDGDLCTDENLTQVRNPGLLTTTTTPPQPTWSRPGATFYVDAAGTGFRPVGQTAANYSKDANNNFILDPASVLDQTRGVVWGAERPELLMTESLAWHDRRVEDLTSNPPPPPPGPGNSLKPGEHLKIADEPVPDLDQRLRPLGACFVELYNPWSEDTQHPAELYKPVDLNGDGLPDTSGVNLDRMNPQSSPTTPTSPVWRISVICEHPSIRNDSEIVDSNLVATEYERNSVAIDSTGIKSTNTNSSAIIYQPLLSISKSLDDLVKARDSYVPENLFVASSQPFRMPDTTFPGFPFDAKVGPLSPAAPPIDAPTNKRIPDPTNPGGEISVTFKRVQLVAPSLPCYEERAFFMVRPGSRDDHTDDPATDADNNLVYDNLGMRIPLPRTEVYESNLRQASTAAWDRIATKYNNDADYLNEGLRIYNDPVNTQNPTVLRFHGSRFVPPDVTIAPILPGRYGVVGTAGRKLDSSPDTFAVSVGRNRSFGAAEPSSGNDYDREAGILDPPGNLSYRRIELHPSANPTRHQVGIMNNGGPEVFRVPGQNVSDPGIAEATRSIQPAVAIPVEDMSVSTPVDNYILRRAEIEALSDPYRPLDWNPYGAGGFNSGGVKRKGDGQYERTIDGAPKEDSYDIPFDTAPELIMNQTTANYKTLHLQRLANPLLPWNPPQGQEGHDSELQVNPYLAIDTISVDLTAMNGASSLEKDLDESPSTPEDLQRAKRLLPNSAGVNDDNRPRLALRSHERISHEPQQSFANGPTTVAALQSANKVSGYGARNIWQQRSPRLSLQIDDDRFDVESNGASFLYDRVYDDLGTFNDDRYVGLEAELRVRNYVDYPAICTLGFGAREEQIAFRADGDQSTLKKARDPMNPTAPVRAKAIGRVGTDRPIPYNPVRSHLDASLRPYDLNGDGLSGEAAGAPAIVTNDNNTTQPEKAINDSTYPYFTWNNRPFANEGELLQVPAASSSRMLTYYSTFNANAQTQPNAYTADDTNAANPAAANKARWDRQHAPFGHLLNAMQTSSQPCRVTVAGTDVVATGAPNFARILDYVHVPSKFVQTDLMLSPGTFQGEALPPTDPRVNFSAPFNRVAEYREPGKVNLNTIVGRRTDPVNSWSEVYDGLMHRIQDGNYTPGNVLQAMGHLGPAWRDVVLSRKGYADPRIVSAEIYDSSPMTLNPNFPSVISNPFRNADAGDLVPLEQLRQTGAEASILRPHPWSPGEDGAWGFRRDLARGFDGDDTLRNPANDAVIRPRSSVADDADEAGAYATNPVTNAFAFSDDVLMRDNTNGKLLSAEVTPTPKATRVPLFSGATLEPALDTERNPAFRYGPIQRLSSMTTTRSGVFAVWITVGFFEVKPVANDSRIMSRYANMNSDVAQRALFDRIYPEGYTLGKELGSDTGDIHRHRAFYLVDRTLPVAFKPGEDLNVDKAVLVRRRIE